jgi:hypothetical protein
MENNRSFFLRQGAALAEEERHALADLARQKIREDRFPLSPRLAPLKSALAKLDPGSAPKPPKELPPLPTGLR